MILSPKDYSQMSFVPVPMTECPRKVETGLDVSRLERVDVNQWPLADVFFARNEIRMLILHHFDLDDAMNEPRLLIVIN